MSQLPKGERTSKKVFTNSISFNKNDRPSNVKAVNKQGILDAAKALKAKKTKQTSKFRQIFEETSAEKQSKVAAISKSRGNTIVDMRNLDRTEADLKLELYRQKQKQLKSKKGTDGKYSLNDEKSGDLGQSMGGNDVLTHGGKAINDMSESEFRSFDRHLADTDSDDEDNKAIGRDQTTAHFGGGKITEKRSRVTRLSDEEWNRLSLPERYKFLMQMSKENKADKKDQAARTRSELAGLDSEYKDILSMLEFTRGGESDDDDDEIEAKLQMKGDKLGLNKEEYLQSLFDRYNIDESSKNGDNDDDSFDEDDDDDDDEDDSFDEDDFDSDDEEDSDDEATLAKKMAKHSANVTPASFTSTITHIDDEFEEQKWQKAMAAPKIGLDGKAIGTSETRLTTGLKIGSNAGHDDYLSQTLTFKQSARTLAGDRLVSDSEKASRHRNYLLFLEERRLRRKNGTFTEDDEDALEDQYESLFMNKRAMKKKEEKDDNELVLQAMMDGDDDDDDVDVSTGLRKRSGDDGDDDDGYDDDEDGYDDDEDDYSDDYPSKSSKPTHKSGDTLDEDYLLDDDVGGIDEHDYADEEIESMEVGGETSQLFKAAKRGRFESTPKDKEKRDAHARAARKAELGMFVNDIDGVLQKYYLSTENIDYRRFIAKIKVTIRDEIPYNYEFPNTFSEFITLIFSHLDPILSIYSAEYKLQESNITKLSSEPPQVITIVPEDTENRPFGAVQLPTTKTIHFLRLSESNLRAHVISLIFGRLFQLFHPRISPSNEARIEILYRFLWRLLKVITQQQEYLQKEQLTPSDALLPPPQNKAYIVRTIHDVIAISDVITSYIFTIQELLPRYTGRACIGLVELFSHSAKTPDFSAILPDPEQERQTVIFTQNWGQKIVVKPPEVHELFAYKLLMQLYPLSDSRHTIMTPLQLLLAQSVTQCYVSNNNDLTKMVFLMGLLLEFWKSSDKYVPEAISSLQSLISLLSNSFIPQNEQLIAKNQFLNPHPTQNKPKSQKKPQEETTQYQWTPTMLESWRECQCTISSGTLNTITTLPNEFQHNEDRSTGILPIQWLTYSPLISQQHQTEYYRFALITTLDAFVQLIVKLIKGLTSCNEILEPIVLSLQALIANITTFTQNIIANPQPIVKSTTPVVENKKKKGKKGNNDSTTTSPSQEPLLNNQSTQNLEKYTKLIAKLSNTLVQCQQIATKSIAYRKPLQKYAAVIAPIEYEPLLDADKRFDPNNKAMKREEEVKERKRLEKKLASRQKGIRKDIKKNVFEERVKKQKIEQERDELRKSRLTRARQIVQGDIGKDSQSRKNFKKQKN